MSYLNLPRLNFAGQFQADVSTVNNDPRHFDNASFEPYFQEMQEKHPQGTQWNGWWNPVGTGIFRLNNCRVTSLLGANGPESGDMALTCAVGNSSDRASAKLVDLDPDWQLASTIFGLTITLTDAKGEIVLQGDYQPNPFRDLWFSRTANKPGDTAASATFQSVLENVRWNLNALRMSPFLQHLHKAAESGSLSVRLTTYAYIGDSQQANFSYGKLIGSIGLALAEEPRSFILGRRFMPQNAAKGTSANNITCFSSIIDNSSSIPTLQVDLSNALPLDPAFKIIDQGSFIFGVLLDSSIQEGGLVNTHQYISLGAVSFSQEVQDEYSGIQAFSIPADAQKILNDHPIALIQLKDIDTGVVCLRESPNGLEVRAEQIIFRLDPNDPSANTGISTLYAAQYGLPLTSAQQITVTLQPAAPDDSDCPPSVPSDTTPSAPIPVNNIPANAITAGFVSNFAPGKTTVGEVQLTGPAVMGLPRQYIDGQLFNLTYNFTNTPVVQQMFDSYAVLVFSSFDAPAKPSWQDVQPVLQQYANLYPVMSKGVFDFSQQEVANANADLLYFVFSNNNFLDPDYMPVTRDMSSSKRKMLVDYFDQHRKTHAPKTSLDKYASRCPFGFDRQR